MWRLINIYAKFSFNLHNLIHIAEHCPVTIDITNDVPMWPDPHNYRAHKVTTTLILVNVKAFSVMYCISQITESYIYNGETVVFGLHVESV